MSRGWESKDVESQMEEAAAKRELSRARVLKDLEAATHERRRRQLQAALDYLNGKLAALE